MMLTRSNKNRLAHTLGRFSWGTVASWVVGLLAIHRALIEISTGAGDAPPGVPYAVLGAGLILLPPIASRLQHVVPGLRPIWAPPLVAFSLVVLVAVVGISASPGQFGAPGHIIKERAATQDDTLLYPAFAKKILSSRLRDPASARITSLTAYRSGGSLTLCGAVNAKNAFGAYAGADPFIITDGGIYIGESEATPEIWATTCTGDTRYVVADVLLDN